MKAFLRTPVNKSLKLDNSSEKTKFKNCFNKLPQSDSGTIIGLLLVFTLFRRQDFCFDHMTSQLLQICFLLI